MNALPDIANYQALGALAPEPEPDDCPHRGNYYTPGCRPRFVSPYQAARSRERLENSDFES